jgi:hypothetical protein
MEDINLDELRRTIEARTENIRTIFQPHDYSEGLIQSRLIPKEVFHYTDATGLQGILNKRKIWATHFQYLNDSSEIRHHLDHMDKMIEEGLMGKSDDEIQVINTIRQAIEEDLKTRDYYIACYCEEGDLLSQWRGYGKGGEGYSVGFTPNLTRLASAPLKNTEKEDWAGVFSKVLYTEADKNRILSSIICLFSDSVNDFQKLLIDHILKDPTKNRPANTSALFNEIFRPMVDQFVSSFLQIAYRFKSHHFSEEREWRFVLERSKKEDKPISFRAGRGMMIPYTEIDVQAELKDNPLFEISSIVCGPSEHPVLKKQSVEMLLRQIGGYEKTRVVKSCIPLRML